MFVDGSFILSGSVSPANLVSVLGVGNIIYKNYRYNNVTAGEVYDNIPVAYGITMVIEGNTSGNAALISVGYSQTYMHTISDPANLIGRFFNVEHASALGPHIKVTALTKTTIIIIAVG